MITSAMPDRKILITPSILSADFSKLQQEVDSVSDSADWLQIDVMDGHFVPALTFGAVVVQSIKTALPLDIHLMVQNPADRIDEFLKLGVANITFHAEAVKGTEERRELIDRIHKGGAKAGIAINPETAVDEVGDVLANIDLLLVMTVHPGFAAQEFIEHVLSQVKTVRSAFPHLMIQVDGGINEKTAPLCIKAGADNLVAGSFIFKAKNRTLAIKQLRTL